MNKYKNNNLIKVGKIVGIHGINGNLKFFSYFESKESLNAVEFFFINKIKYKPLMLKEYRRGFLLKLEGIDNRDLAEEFVGRELFTPKDVLPNLNQEDIYYWNDLIGVSVFEENNLLGKLVSIIETGANDVYVIKGEDGEILIPAVNSFVLNIDIKKKRMEVKQPEYF